MKGVAWTTHVSDNDLVMSSPNELPLPKALGAFVAYKAAVLFLAFVSLCTVAHIFPASPGHFITLLFEWDAKHVMRAAIHGYSTTEPNIQILPGIIVLIRLFHLVIPDWQWAAFAAVQVSSFLALLFLYKLARLDLDEPTSRVALVAFALFPTAYFLTAPYTEALFCAASFATVYFFRTRRYREGAVAGALATLTRIPGIFLIPAIAAHAWTARKTLSRKDFVGTIGIIAGLAAGFGAYLATNKRVYGQWLFFMSHESQRWGIHLSWPFSGALAAIQGWHGRSPDLKMSIVILEIGLTLFSCVGLWGALKRRNALDFVYQGLSLLLLVSLSFWISRPRLILPMYPMFTAVAPMVRSSTLALGTYLLVSGGLFGIYWSLYLSAQWGH